MRPLLERVLGGVQEIAVVEAASESLGPVVPIQRRADLVLMVTVGGERLVIVIEVQLRRDPEKRWVWPVYLTSARDRHRAAAALVVVAFDPAVARWAARPIQLGPPGSVVRPLVAGPGDIPVVTDPDASAEELVISALAHGRGPDGLMIGEAAVAALARLDEDRSRIYADLILSALAPAAQRHMEHLMQNNYAYASALFRRLVSEGREEGLHEGRSALRAGVLAVFDARGVALTADERGQLAAEQDLVTLRRWLTRSATARSFAEATRAVS
jgi:hypothetical protein